MVENVGEHLIGDLKPDTRPPLSQLTASSGIDDLALLARAVGLLERAAGDLGRSVCSSAVGLLERAAGDLGLGLLTRAWALQTVSDKCAGKLQMVSKGIPTCWISEVPEETSRVSA